MIGVVLAGGKSTRMPHKLWLCECQSGVNIVVANLELMNKYCGLNKRVVCLNQDDHAFSKMIRRYDSLVSQHLDSYTGFQCLNELLQIDDLCVLCGDNVYGDVTWNAIALHKRTGPHATAYAAVNKLTRHTQLDKYDPITKRWVDRDTQLGAFAYNANMRLTTPWFIPKGYEVKHDRIVDCLNDWRALPLVVNDPKWHDLGTPESVKEYYKCSSLKLSRKNSSIVS